MIVEIVSRPVIHAPKLVSSINSIDRKATRPSPSIVLIPKSPLASKRRTETGTK